MDRKRLMELRAYAEKLSKGIDPTTGLKFAEDTILNSVKIKSYNKQMAVLLKRIIELGAEECIAIRKPGWKLPFFLSDEEIDRFQYFEEPVSISKLVYKMNENVGRDMKKLRPADVTTWLQREGYLEECAFVEERAYKRATAKGEQLGIISCRKLNNYGNEYAVNLYTIGAQRFVVENINDRKQGYESITD